MRLLLAFVAVLGLILSPAAAAAGTAACAHHGGPAVAMSMSAQAANTAAASAEHACCDDPQKSPKHDDKACDQACQLMAVSPVALVAFAAVPLQPAGRPLVEHLPPVAVQAHPPPGLERPPRAHA